MNNEEKVKEGLSIIVENADVKALNYAVAYAREGLRMTGHDLAVQCLYVLNNMQYWRGAVAKEIRQNLKDFAKIHNV